MANPNEPKDQQHKKNEEEKAVSNVGNLKQEITPELAADKMYTLVLNYAIQNLPMPQVRTSINVEAKTLCTGFNEAQMKEFSLALRTKFERMRQFTEAAGQEVMLMTSQIGW